MNTDFLQVTFLAVLQGVTEFLPISSSGHLILPAALLGWEDQGLVFDVSVHVGSLFAVLYYFRAQVWSLMRAWLNSAITRESDAEARLAWLLVLATLPAGIAGFMLNDYVEQYGRSILVIASTSIVFALLLWLGDRRSEKDRTLADLNWKSVLLIGFAQMLALIPGTSRSGATMTAGLFVNLSRHAASQFSFLLAIPVIAASGLLKLVEFVQLEVGVTAWIVLLYGAMLSGVVSYLCIHYFLKLIERTGFLPFVLYRLGLGVVLFIVYYAS